MKKTILLTGAALVLGVSAQAQSTIADWTFETSLPTTSGPFTPETGSGAATGSHAGASVYSSPAGNGSSHSFSSTVWATGDYYQIKVSTLGYSAITLSFDQASSGTGPGNFQLEYSTDNMTYTDIGSTYAVQVNGSPNTAWSVGAGRQALYTYSPDLTSLAATLADQSEIFFRFVDVNTTAANGGTVGTGGTDRMDNILVSGTAAVPEPSSLALLGVGGTFCLGFLRRLRK